MPNPLIEAVHRFTNNQSGASPFATAVAGLTILRSDREKPPNHVLFRPALCIVVQGAKWVMFGDRRFDYRAGQAVVISVEMPLLGRVAEASPGEPYLGVIIEFDLPIMREVLAGLDTPPEPASDPEPGLFVADLDEPLTDCTLRLVRLLDTPAAIPFLRPLIMREVCYWLLAGPHGAEIARLALANDHAHRIIHAIHELRDRFAEPVRIEALAAAAGLSGSTFHRQFKAITSMTPLQYQKNLRLLEARRLLMADAANVEAAALQVGYESPSQFSREYSRMFGAPPRRDIAGLRTLVAAGSRSAAPDGEGWDEPAPPVAVHDSRDHASHRWLRRGPGGAPPIDVGHRVVPAHPARWADRPRETDHPHVLDPRRRMGLRGVSVGLARDVVCHLVNCLGQPRPSSNLDAG